MATTQQPQQQTTTTTTIIFSQPTLDKANKVRLTIENFYENLFQEYEEREERYRRLEETMKQQGLSESEVESKNSPPAAFINYLFFCLENSRENFTRW